MGLVISNPRICIPLLGCQFDRFAARFTPLCRFQIPVDFSTRNEFIACHESSQYHQGSMNNPIYVCQQTGRKTQFPYCWHTVNACIKLTMYGIRARTFCNFSNMSWGETEGSASTTTVFSATFVSIDLTPANASNSATNSLRHKEALRDMAPSAVVPYLQFCPEFA